LATQVGGRKFGEFTVQPIVNNVKLIGFGEFLGFTKLKYYFIVYGIVIK